MAKGDKIATTTFHVLWRDPLVCVISAGWGSIWGARIAVGLAQGRECHILARPANRMDGLLPEIVQLRDWLAEEHPNARLWSLAASEADAALVSSIGVEGVWATITAFVDERLYYPELTEPKLYDAVHTARTDSFKRHELAHGVGNLALITYTTFASADDIAQVVGGYRDLRFVNWSAEAGHRMLDPTSVRRIVSRSRCGLLLSESEGANNASVEYFLCGVPLVTTPSRGGRDQLYDPRHVTIVPPEPAAVEAAVAAYKASAPDPLEIRAALLARARPHRERLIAWLSRIAGRDLAPLADGNLWLPTFRDKVRDVWRIDDRGDGGWIARQGA